MTLADLKIGESAVLSDIYLKEETRQYLMDLGLTKGTLLTVRNYAPLGDPIEIIVRGCRLCLSLSDAKQIKVEI